VIPAMRSLPSDLCAECWGKIKAAAKAEKERRREKKRPRVEAKRGRSLNEWERWVALKTQAMLRDSWTCVMCRTPVGLDCHHLEPGGAKHRRERIENVITLCRWCHDAYHANVSRFAPAIKNWCDAHGYPYPNRKEYR